MVINHLLNGMILQVLPNYMEIIISQYKDLDGGLFHPTIYITR